MKQCDTCGEMFCPSHGNQVRCSDNPNCRRKYWREKSKRLYGAKHSHLWSQIKCVDCGEPFDAEMKQARRPKRCAECIEFLATDGPMPQWVVGSCPLCDRDFLHCNRNRLYCSNDCRKLANAITNREVQRQRVLNGRCPRHGKAGHCEICHANNFAKSSKRRGKGDVKYRTRSKIKIRQLCAQQKWKCSLCDERLSTEHKSPHPLSISIDHVIPISLGGTHDLTNLSATHLHCNIRKGNRSLGPEQLRMLV